MPADGAPLHAAAGLSILAGLVHGALVEEHFTKWWALGVFFTLAALAQGLFGFGILASRVMNDAPVTRTWPPRALRPFLIAGILGNAALIFVYVLSRTVGFLGVREEWGALGIFTKLLEAAVVILLGAVLARADARAPPLP